MITYSQAKDIIIEAGQKYSLNSEIIGSADAAGYVCAKDINASITIQPFDNSAMDGFAFKYDEGKYNDDSIFKKTMVIAAGDPIPERQIKPDECAQIMTGAPVPMGVDTVIPIENVVIDGDNIKFIKSFKKGDHIRKAGEDFQKGQTILSRGDIITSQHIMPLATLGIAQIEVFKKPRAAFIATGKELVDDLSKELQSGQIYNSNAPYAGAALKQMGVDCVKNITISDNQESFEKEIISLMEKENDIDLIISSGAVSAGEFDFVKSSLKNIGAEILFHKVLIKPGKPILFAKLPNGTFYFGLPGNPAASSAGLRFFVTPLLRAMRAQSIENPAQARVINSFSKKAGMRMFLKAKAQSDNNGILNVELLKGQASFMVSPFLQMDCWAVAKEDVDNLNTGDIIEIFPL